MSAPLTAPTSLPALWLSFVQKQAVSESDQHLLIGYVSKFASSLATPADWSVESLTEFLAKNNFSELSLTQRRTWLSEFVRSISSRQIGVTLYLFELALIKGNCSKATVRNYRSDINQFFDFCQTTEVSEALTKPKLQAFEQHQSLKGLQPSSIKRKVSSITQFGQWLHKAGYPIELVVENLTAAEVISTPVAEEKIEHEISSSQLETDKLAELSLREEVADLKAQVKRQARAWFLPYLTLATLILFFAGLAVFGYRQFFRDVPTPLAYPSSPVRADRVLSFQGRLTDTAQNPITTATNMTFKLFDSGPSIVSGTELWSSGTCSVTPDQDGIFNAGLGDDCGSEIPDDVFTENANVWLQVQVAAETLSPRQPIRTVAYAINSETVQGYPVTASGSATVNTLLTMDSSGNVILGETSPKLKSVSGTFTLEGQTIKLQTTSGGNGNIIIDADGTGGTFINDYLKAPGATLSATYAGGVPLTVLGGPSGMGNLANFQNNGGTNLLTVDASGNLSTIGGIGHSFGNVGGNLTLNSAGTIELLDATNVTGALSATGNINSSGGSLQTGGTSRIDNSGNLTNIGTTQLNGITYTWPGSQNSNYILQTNGSGTLTWADPAALAGASTFWLQNNGALYPKNSTVDFLLGGQATSSAKFAVLNLNSGTPTATLSGTTTGAALYMTGEGTLATTQNRSLLLNPTGGFVGIGTSNPAAKLDVVDTLRVTSLDGTNWSSINTTNAGNSRWSYEGSSTYLDLNQNGAITAGSRFIVGTAGGTGDTGDLAAGANGGSRIAWLRRVSTNRPTLDFYNLSNVLVNSISANTTDPTYFTGALFGIGTSTPTAFTHINGGYGANDALTVNQTLGGNILSASSSGTTRLILTNGGQLQASAGTSSAPGYSFLNASGLGFYLTGGNEVSLSPGGHANRQIRFGGVSGSNWAGTYFTNDNFATHAGIGRAQVSTTINDGLFIGDIGATATLRGLAMSYLALGTQAGNTDVYLQRDAAQTFGQRNSTNAQQFNIYNTYTSATNYERAEFNWIANSNVFTIQTGRGSLGGSTRDIALQPTSGKVGIGTIAPTALLHINGGYGANDALTVNQTLSGNIFSASASGTTRMVLTNSGNLGIGTTTPNQQLEIQGTTTPGGALRLSSADTTVFTDEHIGQIDFYSNDASLNGVGVGAFVKAIAEDNGTLYGLSFGTGQALAGATEKLRLTNDGNLGIMAQGDLRLYDTDSSNYLAFQAPSTVGSNLTYTFPGSVTNGYVLQTDGSGTLTWADPAVLAGATDYWASSLGTLYPKNSTLDFLLGGQATSSAKFAVLNLNSGTPTATLSGTTTGAALYMTGEGTLATTRNRSLLLNPTGGNVGIGTSNPSYKLEVNGQTAITPTTGTVLKLGANVDSSTATPVSIDMGGTYSNTAGQNPKIMLYKAGVLELGFGFSLNEFDYIAHSAGTHVFWSGTTRDARIYTDGVRVPSTSGYIFTSDTGLATPDTGIARSSAGVIKLTNGSSGDGSLYAGGSANNYFAGNVGIGTTGPDAKLDSLSTTGEQLRLTYTDGSAYTGFTTNSGGDLTIVPSGGDVNITGNLALTGTTTLNSQTYTWPGSQTANYVLQTNGSGTLSWADPTSFGLWRQSLGAISPINNTFDLLVGSNATSSAKFAVLNVNNGTPVASVSSGVSGTALSMSADGTLTTSSNRPLAINPTGGNVGIGTSTPGDKLTVQDGNLRLQRSDTTNTRLTNYWGGSTSYGMSIESNISSATAYSNSYGIRLGTIFSSLPTSGTYDQVRIIDSFAPTSGTAISNAFTVMPTINQTGGANGISRGIYINPTLTAAADFRGLEIANNSGYGIYQSGASATNYFNGTSGFGTTGPDAKIDSLSTTGEQLRLTYTDGSAYTGFTTSSGGDLTVAPSGSDTNITGNLDVSGTFASGTANALTIDASGNVVTTGTLTANTDETINGIDINAGAVSDITTLAASGQITFSTFTTNGGILYTNGSGVLAQTSVGSSGECLQSNGGGAPTWGSCNATAVNYWRLTNGAFSPVNDTADVLIGSTATSSAKFAFLNVNSGTPTASVSAGTTGATYITAAGSLQTTARQSLNLGGTTTGNTNVLNTAGTAIATFDATNSRLGLGTTAPASKLEVVGDDIRVSSEVDANDEQGAGIEFYNTLAHANAQKVVASITPSRMHNTFGGGALLFNTTNDGVGGTPTTRMIIGTSGNVGIGATSDSSINTRSKLNVFVGSGDGVRIINSSGSGVDWLLTPGVGGVDHDRFGLYNADSSTFIWNAKHTGDMGIGTTGQDARLDVLTTSGEQLRLTYTDGTVYTGFTTNSGGDLTIVPSGGDVNITGNLALTGTTTLNSQTYTWPGSQTANYVLQTNGSGTLSWTNPQNFGLWRQSLGALSPINDTMDLLVGSNASSSAKFAVLNVNSGTPVASISANSGNINTYLTGNGTLATTNRQSLTIGNSSTYNTTGNVLINSNGQGSVGIGTTTPSEELHVVGDILAGTSFKIGSTNTQIDKYGGWFRINTTGSYGLVIDNAAASLSYNSNLNSTGLAGLKVTHADTAAFANIGALNAVITNNAYISGRAGVGTTSPTAVLHVSGGYGANDAFTVNQTNSGNIFSASASGTTRLTLSNAGNLIFNQASTIQTSTGNLTLDSTGGTIELIDNTNITGNLDVSGTFAAGTADALTIDASGNVVTSGILTAATNETINGIDINAGAVSDITTLDASSTVTFSSFTTDGGVLYTNGSGVLAQTAVGSSGQCLQSNGGGAPTWGSCTGGGSFSNWRLTNGAFSPVNDTADVLIGSNATSSAKFAFMNVNSGTPTASISAGTTGATYITADGKLQTTARQNLSLGGTTTGNTQVLNTAGSAFATFDATNSRLGIGTAAPLAKLSVGPGVGEKLHLYDDGAGTIYGMGIQASLMQLYAPAGSRVGIGNGSSGSFTEALSVIDGKVGIGNTSPNAPLSFANAVGEKVVLFDGGSAATRIGSAIQTNDFQQYVGASTNNFTFRQGGQNGTELMRLLGTGNLGVGTTGPDARIDSLATSGEQLRLTYTDGSAYTGFTTNSGGDLTIVPSGGDVNITGNLSLTGTTTFNSQTYTWPGSQTANYVLQTNGTGTLSWADPTQFGLWRQSLGAISPINNTFDLLVGSNATSSAKFAVLNVNSGTPTASVSAGTSGAAYLTAAGALQTTARQTLSLGGSTTGNTNVLNTAGTAFTTFDATNSRVGIGTAAPGFNLEIADATDPQMVVTDTTNTVRTRVQSQNTVGVLGTSSNHALRIQTGSTNAISIDTSQLVGIGTTAPDARLDSLSTSGEQLRLTYTDGSVYTGFTTNSSGDLTVAPSGSDANITGNLDVSGTFASGTADALTIDASGNLVTTGTLTANTNETINGIDINAGAVSDITTLSASSTITFSSFTTNGGVLYTNGSGVLAQTAVGSSGECLKSAGAGAPTWGSCTAGAGSSNWRLTNGAFSPINDTADVLIGSTATSSAKFAFINVNSGTPTASISAGTSGATYIAASGLIQTTANQNLTIGGNTTGNITLAPLNGAGTVNVTGNADVSGTFASGTGNAFTIDATGNTVTSGTVTAATNETINGVDINNGAISDVTTLSASSTINTTGGTIQTNSTSRIDNSGNLTNIGTTQLNGQTYTWPGSITAGGVLQTSGGGALSWADPAGFGQWRYGNGAISPINNTYDLLVGSNASSSAKFAVLNVNSGTPTASVSAGTAGGAYITADGKLATTAKQTLTLGDTNTGNVVIPSSNLGIGNTQPFAQLHLTATGESGVARGLQVNANDLNTNATITKYGNNGGLDLRTAWTGNSNITSGITLGEGNAWSPDIRFYTAFQGATRSERMRITDIGNIGIGTTTPTSLFHVNGGYANNALATFNQLNSGDILTASASGATRMRLTNNGNMIIGPSTAAINYNMISQSGTASFASTNNDLYIEDILEVGGSIVLGGNQLMANALWQNNGNVYSPIGAYGSVADLAIGGTATSSAKFQIFGNSGVASSSGTLTFRGTTDPKIDILNGENFGIRFSPGGDAGVSEKFTILANGNVGIGDTNPASRLSIGGSTSSITNTSGDITIDATSNTISFAGDLITNFSAAQGTNGSTSAPTFSFTSDTDTGMYMPTIGEFGFVTAGGERMRIDSAGKVAIGLTSPTGLFHVSGKVTGKALAIFNETGNQDIIVASASGTTRFRVANDGHVYAQRFVDTSSNSFYLDPADGTTSLAIAGDITLDSGGTIESTGNNNIDIDAGSGNVLIGGGTGKLDAGTIDPPYWIEGKGYATYVASMVGLNEEIASTVTLQPSGTPGLYKYVIDFPNLNKDTQTDLWLFGRIIDMGDNMENLVVLLSQHGSGQVMYKKDAAKQQLIIYGAAPTEVSFRLTAPRFNHEQFGTVRSRQDGRGFQPVNPNYQATGTGSSDTDLLASLTQNPTVSFTDLGTVVIGDAGTTVTTADNTAVTRVEAFWGAVIGRLRAGLVDAQQLVASMIVISPEVKTDVITPMNSGDLEINLTAPNGIESGELAIVNHAGEKAITLDGDGNISALGDLIAQDASFSGEVVAEGITATSARLDQLESKLAELESVRAQTAEIITATISGTLYADNIDGFDSKVANALQQPSLLEQLMGDDPAEASLSASMASLFNVIDEAGFTASGSGSLNRSLEDLALATDDLSLGATAVFVNKYFEVNGTGYISESLGVGEEILIGEGMRVADGFINYTSPTNPAASVLHLQPSGQGSVSILAGALTINQGGQVIVTGDLTVAGNLRVENTLLASLIQPTDFANPLQVKLATRSGEVNGDATESAQVTESRFEIVNELGVPVATISGQGRAEFAGGLGIGAEDLSAAAASTTSGEVATQRTSGKALIPAGSTEIMIRATQVTAESLIQVTPQGSTNNQVMYVKAQVADDISTPENEAHFVVGFDAPLATDANFNWWIVN
ncbi:MAG TPA: site-specific integrase [Vitreimonas sp.]|nr:site-specific integrase [Vitreimonas sp.]